jgi:hypothetical protein
MNIAKKRILSSIPIVGYASAGAPPTLFGRGCFVEYNGTMLFMTVQHLYTVKDKQTGKIFWADNKKERLSIQIEFNSDKKSTLLKPIGEMCFLNKGTREDIIGGNFIMPKAEGEVDRDRVIDFAYKKMGYIQCKRQDVDEHDFHILSEENRVFLKDDLNTIPSTKEEYGFAGVVKPSLIPPKSTPSGIDKWVIPATNIAHNGFKFIQQEGDYLVFSAPYQKHPGHEWFQGTSGAPILDSNGNLVALVCWGDTSTNLLYGLNLRKYKSALDIEIQ